MAIDKHSDGLVDKKDCVRQSREYFADNVDRFVKFMRFTFESSITDEQKSMLKAMDRPILEFNIVESLISRQRGEFYKQEPSIEVSSSEGNQVDPKVISGVEGHLRHIFNKANQDGFEYTTYTDSMGGGFSVMKLSTEYANPNSFNQIFKLSHAEPTMTGFDPLATLPHKGDGNYCFEIFPKYKKDFQDENPDIDISKIKFSRDIEGYSWSYKENDKDILILCDYYEKIKKQKTIVQLTNGKIMDEKAYKKLAEQWNSLKMIAQIPNVHQSRKTDTIFIKRTQLIEDQIIEEEDLDYIILPLIFCDGNSMRINNNGVNRQITRPYIYHAMGVQQLKNFAGQTLAGEIENLMQHKFFIAKESIPNEKPYLDAYTNIQKASHIVYNAFKINDPTIQNPPPREIQRVPTPPEVPNTFAMCDQLTQTILGSYDASLGINNNQLSGIAITEGATQSNAAAMPYVVGYMHALGQLATGIIDLIPKYFVTERTIPIVGIDGKSQYITINGDNGVSFNYDENALKVEVKAGLNFSVQKTKALQQIIAMSQASPIFAQFMNTVGLEVLLDNLEIRGIDQLKLMASQFTEQMQKQQQMQQQQQQQQMQMQQMQIQMQMQQAQNNPAMLKAKNEQQKIMLDAQQAQAENQIKIAELSIEKQATDNEMFKVMAEAQEARQSAAVQLEKSDTERAAKAIDFAIKTVDMDHRHRKEIHELNNPIYPNR